MGDLRKIFGTNKKKEEEGVWFPVPESDGEFLIARANNERAEKMTIQLMKPHRRLARQGRLSTEVQKKVTIAVMANAILLGWRGGLKIDGKALPPYSPVEAERLLTEMPDLTEFVAGCATEQANFQDQEEEERRGNSQSASSGT